MHSMSECTQRRKLIIKGKTGMSDIGKWNVIKIEVKSIFCKIPLGSFGNSIDGNLCILLHSNVCNLKFNNLASPVRSMVSVQRRLFQWSQESLHLFQGHMQNDLLHVWLVVLVPSLLVCYSGQRLRKVKRKLSENKSCLKWREIWGNCEPFFFSYFDRLSLP